MGIFRRYLLCINASLRPRYTFVRIYRSISNFPIPTIYYIGLYYFQNIIRVLSIPNISWVNSPLQFERHENNDYLHNTRILLKNYRVDHIPQSYFIVSNYTGIVGTYYLCMIDRNEKVRCNILKMLEWIILKPNLQYI